jgi:hypothetical protein
MRARESLFFCCLGFVPCAGNNNKKTETEMTCAGRIMGQAAAGASHSHSWMVCFFICVCLAVTKKKKEKKSVRGGGESGATERKKKRSGKTTQAPHPVLFTQPSQRQSFAAVPNCLGPLPTGRFPFLQRYACFSLSGATARPVSFVLHSIFAFFTVSIFANGIHRVHQNRVRPPEINCFVAGASD